jgi:hypothetical protein
MRRARLRLPGLVVLVLLTSCGLALAGAVARAADPLHGRAYRGTMADYLNNAPHWTAERTTGTATLRVSAAGTKIARFTGSYYYYCGAGRATIRGRAIPITARGTFRSTAHARQRYGTDYYMLSGRFLDGGRRVALSYLSDFVSSGQHVGDPYSTAFRHGPCESWVHGTISVIRH